MCISFRDQVIDALPNLSGFALRLSKNSAQADDLLQETVLRAFLHEDQFRPGTNLRAWLCTILRNCYINDRRTAGRVGSIETVEHALIPAIKQPQETAVQIRELSRQMYGLPAPQREALMLVAVNGYSYEDAADLAGCAIGTMKSRVSRARRDLQMKTGHNGPDAFLDHAA